LSFNARPMACTTLAALVLAGCGGDDGSSNGELSYSEFSKQADQICKEERAKTEATVAKLTGDPTNDKPLWDKLVPQLESGYGRIEKLKPPEELQAAFDRFNGANQETLTQAEELQADADQGDAEAYAHAFKQLQSRPDTARAAGSKLGAAECAK
jgi:hypothetical protein